MKVLDRFIIELRKFSAANWWVYVIYLAMMAVIFYFEEDSTLAVFVVTSIHFIADIFIMMMISAYSTQRYVLGTYFQITSLLLFLSLKIYTGLVGDGWHYLAADPLYILAAIKNYSKDVHHREVKEINLITVFLLSILLIGFLFFAKMNWDIQIFSSFAQPIQTIGIFLFAIALSITDDDRLRYKIAIMALFLMVTSSAWETVSSIANRRPVGLALSYFLLPLTVLVYYIKNWPGSMITIPVKKDD